VIKPQLRYIQGVTEVSTLGGYERQIHVTPDPARLVAHSITLADITLALERNNRNVGAGYIERRGQQLLVRSPGRVQQPGEFAQIVLARRDGVPIRFGAVAGGSARACSFAAVRRPGMARKPCWARCSCWLARTAAWAMIWKCSTSSVSRSSG